MWEKLCSSVVNVLDFNQATLSGSIDIICVRHKEIINDDSCTSRFSKLGRSSNADASNDGSIPCDNPTERWIYRSTPFHVRFGKAKLLKSREKTVSIYVNGELSKLTMKLGSAGEAFFGEETDDDDAQSLEASPESSPPRLPLESLSDDGNEVDKKLGMMDYGYYACNSRGSIGAGARSSSTRTTTPVVNAVAPGSSKSKLTENRNDNILKTGVSFDNLVKKTVSNSREKRENVEESWSWEWGDIPRRRCGSKSAIIVTGEDQILQFSLCGHLLSCQDEQLNSELFQANLVDWDRLDADPSLWYNASLVARFDKRPPYYQSKIALPLLASWIVFNRPLSVGAIERLLKTNVVATSTTNNAHMHPSTDFQLPVKYSLSDFKRPPSSEGGSRRRKYRVSVRPTSEQLASLNLKMGANRITFTVSSALQGKKSVNATLYLWPTDAQIVISDVDGTITKSDALGHIMPILGRDWSHVGVAELFTKIRANGYQVVYLTARAIGQADYTREYLFGLRQNEKEKLPQGPLFLSPDRLLPSFKREVISKSAYMFKIPALRDIRNLFPPDHNPFYAGFGNNESDHRAYVSVGMSESRVFIINPSGIIRHVNSSYAKTYETMSEIAEHMFPPCHSKCSEDEKYNSFQYWNFPMLDVPNNTNNLTEEE